MASDFRGAKRHTQARGVSSVGARAVVAILGALGLVLATAPAGAAQGNPPPDTVFDAPSTGSQETGPIVTLSGTATDDVSVSSVLIAIRDRDQGLWWDPVASAWGTDLERLPATLASPGAISTAWSLDFDFDATGGLGSYFVSAIAIDDEGERDPSAASTLFTVSADGPDEHPETVVDLPVRDSSVMGPVVSISGSASDDVGVAEVELAIKDRVSGLWWDPVTGSYGPFLRFPVGVVSPGAVSTAWSYSVDLDSAGGSGSYWVGARAVDTAGQIDPSVANTRFTVFIDVDPETVFGLPVAGSVEPAELVSLSGSASDDVGVAGVEVAVQDAASLLWWDSVSGVFDAAAPVYAAASVAVPGGLSTAWDLEFDFAGTGGSGSYVASARAVDTAGNVDLSDAVTDFTVFVDVDPETVFELPVAGSVKSAELVSLSGSASDDVGVAGVEVAVQDAVSLLWWDSVSGVFDAAAPVYAAASVALPGEVSTAWDVVFDFAGTGGSGSYVASARAVDTAGNVDLSDAVTDFTIGPVLSYAGDFAPPGQADLTPVDVTTNSTHLYVFDVARYRIARIDRATGMIDAETGGTRSTAEGLFAAARAIAIDSGGNIYVADTPNNRIAKYDADLNYLMKFGANGTGIGQFHQVYSLAVGTGRLADGTLGEVVYSVDGDGRITRWNPDGTVIGYFASAAALNQPRMAEVHPVTDDFWLVNARDREVVVFDVDGNELFRFGSGGTGPGQFRGDPRGITISADGTEIFVSDEGNHRVQVFDQTGNYLREIGGTTPGTADYLVDARGLEITDDGTLVVSDEWDHSMKEFDPTTGVLTRQLFGATAPVGGVNTPRGLAVDPLGRVFVSDWWNQRIQRWESDGSGAFAWGFRGTVDEPGSINFAWDVAVEPVTNRIFVANRESHEIEVFEADGTYVNRFGERGTGDGQLEFPHGVAFGPDGNLWVTDSKGDRLIRFSIDSAGHGTFVANYTNGLDLPTGVAVESNGMVWVADTLNGRYQRLDPTTMTWTVFTAPIGGTTAYRRPWGVSVAPDGTLWLADTNNHRIVNIDNQGNFIAAATGTEMGAGALMQPFDVEVLQYGDLVVSDTFSNRIIVVQVG